MKKLIAKNWGKFYSLAVVLLWSLVSVWALTEKEPPQGRGSYGNVMFIENQEAADFMGVEKPGMYVVNKNHKPVTVVRGGLGMILRGLASGDNDQVSVGWRGLKPALTRTPSGTVLLILASLSAFGWILVAFLNKRMAGENSRMFLVLVCFSLLYMATTWTACNKRNTKDVASDMSKNVVPSPRIQPGESPINILSAKRAKRLVRYDNKVWRVKNAKRDVVLVVEFAGISSEEWKRVPSEQVYIEAGGQRYNPFDLVPWEKWGEGLSKVVLAVEVPQNALEFKLYVGDLPVRTFKAETEILAELRRYGL
jgi:hypothetical protein